MEHSKSHTKLSSDPDTVLQGASLTYRLFYCKSCNSKVTICTYCDRGNIYCPDCKILQKVVRIKRARNKYKKTLKGYKARALSCIRARLKKLTEIEIEGDRGSPSCPDKSMTFEVAEVAMPSQKEVNGNVQDQTGSESSQVTKFTIENRNFSKFSCVYCNRACCPFQRKRPGRRSAKETERILIWASRFGEKVPRALEGGIS
jgi:hypothetical protein